ncbi:MAG: amino acid-binding protein [Clostridia bacterium]|nr:amino acid-binding protein [Clostridia bacterium]
MGVKQLSVFIENTKGSLFRLTDSLGKAGIDLAALSLADTENYGIVRIITNNTDKAYDVLRAESYTVKLTDVLAVCVPDVPGGLAQVLSLLEEAGIMVEYLYSFVRNSGNGALIIMRVSAAEQTEKLLTDNGIRMLTQEEVNTL